MALTTKEIVKAELEIAGSTWDTVLDRMIAAVDLWLAEHCNRAEHGVSLIERQVGRVEYPRGGGSVLYLRCYPIETVSEIKQATDLNHAAATALVENTDFVVDPHVGGRIEHRTGTFYDGAKVVKVTYTGGYYTGAGALPSGARALPAHLQLASTRMVCHVFSHKGKFGERSITVGDMSVSEIKDGLLGIARELLEAERCWTF